MWIYIALFLGGAALGWLVTWMLMRTTKDRPANTSNAPAAGSPAPSGSATASAAGATTSPQLTATASR